MADGATPPIFVEFQRLSPALGVVVVAFTAAVALFVLSQTSAGGRGPAIVSLAVPFAIIAVLFLAAQMRTEVRPGEVAIRMLYVLKRRIPLATVAAFEQRRYRPIRDYGGWGIRWSRHGRAYNMRGDQGIELKMVDGKPILIGSQRPDELLAALKAAKASD